MTQSLKKNDIEDIYPLSPLQEGFLFHALKDSGASFYTDQNCYRLRGDIRVEDIQFAFNELIKRHAVLRTVFNYKKLDRPVQVVLKNREVELHQTDITSMQSVTEKEDFIADLKKRDFLKGFDISQDVMMRVNIIKLADDEFEMIWTHHHILMDGWCMALLLKEFSAIYLSKKNGIPHGLHAATPFRNYIKWLEGFDKIAATRYWTDYLQGLSQASLIPYLGTKPAQASPKTFAIDYTISAQSTDKLILLSKKTGATLNTIMNALWGILLSKYNNSHDVAFGTVVSGRPPELRGVDEMVGLFINTIPTRVTYDETTTFLMLLKNIQQRHVAGLPYHYLPLADIQQSSELKRELINHVVVFENLPDFDDPAAAHSRTDAEVLHAGRSHYTNYPLTINIFPGRQIKISFEGDAHAAQEADIHKIIGHYASLLEDLLESPDKLVVHCSILSSDEKEKILSKGTGACRPEYGIASIVEMFGKAVGRFGDRLALVGTNRSWTYAELNSATNRIANFLLTEHTGEQVVPVLLNRSDWYVIAILGVLKAGKAFLPIDPGNPIKRKEFILIDSGAKILITQIDEVFNFSGYSGSIFSLEEQFSELINDDEPRCVICNESPAYTIYTSGSTGYPKGVLISHRAFANYISWANDYYYDENVPYQFGAFTSTAFDLSLTGIFTSLTRGDRLRVYDEGSVDSVLRQVFAESPAVNFIKLTPSHVGLIGQLNLYSHDLRGIIVGGEHLKNEYISILRKSFPNATIYNEYGPTETTVGCTVEKIGDANDPVTIGAPIPNTKVIVLDNDLNLCADGVIGELYIAGAGLSSGYLNQPELTATRFLAFPQFNDQVFYRTGDLGTWNTNGKLITVGRRDNQFKVQGHRIELTEIENAMLCFDGVTDAAVICHKPADDYILYAYYIANKDIKDNLLIDSLKERLPVYMIPASCRRLDKFPITLNGKIDWKELIAKEQFRYMPIELPKNETESRLLRIWKEVLGQEKIGVTDNFFSLGGHSLLAIRVLSKMVREFGNEVELSMLFDRPTIRQLAAFLETPQVTYEPIPSIEEQDYYEVTPNQKRLWVLSKIADTGTAYQITEAFRLTGHADVKRFERAFVALINRYEILRTHFITVGLEPKQKVVSTADIGFKVHYYDMSQSPHPHDALNEIARSVICKKFDLSTEPLIRAGLFKIDEHENILITSMHHLVYDEWSLEIFRDDLLAFYNGLHIPPLTRQFKDCAAWVNKQLTGEKFKKSQAYWNARFSTRPPALDLPTDFRRPLKKTYNGRTLGRIINTEVSGKIENVIRSLECSEFVFFTAVLNALMYLYTRQTDITLGTPATGRYRSDFEQQVGFFVNTLALRVNVQPTQTFRELVSTVRQCVAEAYDHQMYPFEQLVSDLYNERDQSRSPIFDYMIVFQNAKMNAGREEAIADMGVKHFEIEESTSQFDLMFTIQRSSENFGIALNYNTDLFTSHTIQEMLTAYNQLVLIAMANVDQPLENVNFNPREGEGQFARMLKAQHYWNNTIASIEGVNDINPLLSQPVDFSAYKKVSCPEQTSLSITGKILQQVRSITRTERLTLEAFVHFIWHKLVQGYGASRQSVVGTALDAHLPHHNIVPVVVDWKNNNTVLEQLRDIQARLELINECKFTGYSNNADEGASLFHTLVVFQKDTASADKLADVVLPFGADELRQQSLLFPVSFFAYEHDDTLIITLRYDAEYMSGPLAQQHLTTLKYILEQVIDAPGQFQTQILLMQPSEYDKIVYQWNASKSDSLVRRTIMEIFQEQVDRMPDRVALMFEGRELTYREVNEKSNQLARFIRDQYAKKAGQDLSPDTLIALCVDKSLEMVIAILGVLKAGAAYVPIDPAYPQDRINYLLQDTKAKLVLTQRKIAEDGELQLPLDKILYVDLTEAVYDKEQSTSNLAAHTGSTNMAYVIYTSGTTGKPKGVMITHGNVVRLFTATDHLFKFSSSDVWTLFHSYVFDFSVWELWGALLYGGRLLIVSRENTKDTKAFHDLCQVHKVTILNQTPSAFYRFADIASRQSGGNDLALRYIIFGGEALNVKLLQPWWKHQIKGNLGTKLVNMYGITETTVHVTYKELKSDDNFHSNIGRPLDDLQAYVLDQNKIPVPIGVTGELYIAGEGLGKGYLNNDQLTAERFIPNPFVNGKSSGRLYKTGDLVRWSMDGSLEYIGRNDEQVKIRGYRIELGEIEHALLQIDGIKQACVLVRENKNGADVSKYLVGYYLQDNQDEKLTPENVSNALSKILPAYMVPVTLMPVDSFPLTINGKLDRAALPVPDFNSPREFVPYKNETEAVLCEIWQQVLGLERVGVTDDFFQSGGDSLKLIQLHTIYTGRFANQIKISDLFDRPTIAQQAPLFDTHEVSVQLDIIEF